MFDSSLIFALLAGFIIMLASLSGVVASWRLLGGWIERNLSYLVSFSAGVFFIVALHLAREAFELSINFTWAAVALVVGAALTGLFGYLLPEGHHHHESEDPDDTHDSRGARRVLFGDALHNIGDGLLLVPAFIADVRLGIAAAVGIFVHELVQEISEFFVLRHGGYTTAQALVRNFAVSATILIGIVTGFLLANTAGLLGPLLGIAAGAFFFIVFNDLVPHTVRAHWREPRCYFYHLLAALIGAVLMLSVSSALGHSHDDDHAHNEAGHHIEDDHLHEDEDSHTH